jgi:hypothetical protein
MATVMLRLVHHSPSLVSYREADGVILVKPVGAELLLRLLGRATLRTAPP